MINAGPKLTRKQILLKATIKKKRSKPTFWCII